MAATSKGTHALPNDCIEDIKEENINTNCDNDTSLKEDCSSDELTYCWTARSEFNQGRKIQINDIPPNSKTQDIEEFLKDFKVSDITLDLNAEQAMVTLENGLDAELIVSKLNEKEIHGSKVCVCLLPYTNLLVMAHLPKYFTDKDLSDLLSKYQTVEKCFMMRFEQTDMSLQYGIVCFKDSAERSNAKEEFDWSLIEGCRIHAEFIDICCNYDDLFSRCLFIDNLPKSFKEAYKLREIFNCVASPVYCQIMVRDNESLGYGIIEYKKYWEARETWYKLQDYTLDGVVINVTFCVPDKPAVSIFNRIIRKLDNKSKTIGSLLPDPIISNPITISNPLVKGLASQNPELMKSFMQALQHLQTSYLNQMATPSTKPGLLGPVPSMPTSPAMNPNMQLGLMIFLATHMQNKVNQQFTGPLAAQLNILQKLGQQKNIPDTKPPGDPLTAQANVVIQTLKAQVRGKTTPTPLMASTTESSTAFFQQILQNTRDLNLNLLMNLGQIMSNIQNKKTESLMSKTISPPQNGLFPTPAYSPTHSNNNSKYIRSTDMPPPNRYPFLHSNIQNNIQRQFSATSIPRPLMENFPINSGNRQNNATSPIPLLGEIQHNTVPKPLSLLEDIRQHNSPRPLSLLGDIRQHNSPRPLSLLGDIRQHNSPRPLSLLGDIRQHNTPRPLSLLGEARQNTAKPLLSGEMRQNKAPKPLSLLGDLRPLGAQPNPLFGDQMTQKPLSLLGDLRPLGAQPNLLFGDQMTQKPLSLLGEPPVNLPLQQNVNNVHNIGEYKRQHGSESLGYGGRGSYSGGQDYGQYDSGYWPDTPDGTNDDPFQDLPNKYTPLSDYQNSRRDDKIPSLLSTINQNSNNSNYSNRSTTQSVYQPSNKEQQYQYDVSSTSNYRSNNTNVMLLNPNTTNSYQNSTQRIEYNHDSDKDGLLSIPRNPIINSNRSDNGLFSVPRSVLNSTYKTEYNTNSSSDNSLMKPNSLMPGLMDLNDNRNFSSFSSKPSKSSSSHNYPVSLTSNLSNQGYNIIGTNQFNKHSQENSISFDYSNRGYTSNSRLLKTPVGQKRSYNQLLPAPEPSPEGSYIGQHSQGLGGHYADSYSKRIKLDNRFQ